MQYKNYYVLSAAYGEGTYNTSTYVGTSDQTTTPVAGSTAQSTGNTAQNTGSTGSGALANTGFDLLVGGTIASVIIFTALVVRFSRRKPTTAAND